MSHDNSKNGDMSHDKLSHDNLSHDKLPLFHFFTINASRYSLYTKRIKI
jgi:hypothetical protein